MKLLVAAALCMACVAQLSLAQEYADDYQYAAQDQDSLYHDYAARQENKAVVKPGMPWVTIVTSAGAGWLVGGKFHSRRTRSKLNAKHKQEQKALYQQYYQDVYTLQQQNADLVAAIEQMGVKMR
ncbi:hypothetical protein MPSEU_000866400 [Mayamaea pseudoterrestris]|nr:hypothetical protein MPSEU_000866400 [Mayamaea pseudoterrestris]